jgi:tetraacyldisaccharide 4'-kinase
MTVSARAIGWLWESNGVAARAARTALMPASLLYGYGVARRNARFERMAHTALAQDSRARTAMPSVSVGNLTVGGTGKTPVAAWCAHALQSAGARPALVMRGYGDDEWRVHMLLNPRVPVIVTPDRRDGLVIARTKGADCVVLDDAFQHRQVPRMADLVLLSADRWNGAAALLPAGPFREPLSSLGRAHVAIVTAKAAGLAQVDALVQVVERAAPKIPIAVIRLVLGELRLAAMLPDVDEHGNAYGRPPDHTGLLTRALSSMAGHTFVAASGIGDPSSFLSQLSRTGATIRAVPFADHHRYTDADARRLARIAEGTDGVICTLKDAVKLGRIWPRVAPPLWYVSQSVVVERGASALDRVLARVLEARVATAPTAG